MEYIDFITTEKQSTKRKNSTSKKINTNPRINFGTPYLNKLYKGLLYVAVEIYETYSIKVSQIGELAMILDMEFNGQFVRGLRKLEEIGRLEMIYTGNGWWFEVIPF